MPSSSGRAFRGLGTADATVATSSDCGILAFEVDECPGSDGSALGGDMFCCEPIAAIACRESDATLCDMVDPGCRRYLIDSRTSLSMMGVMELRDEGGCDALSSPSSLKYESSSVSEITSSRLDGRPASLRVGLGEVRGSGSLERLEKEKRRTCRRAGPMMKSLTMDDIAGRRAAKQQQGSGQLGSDWRGWAMLLMQGRMK